jgi:predicted DNA-binding ribbon-helix-helix protein
MSQRITKRSLVVIGHKTSVSLEDLFWDGLKAIAKQRGSNLSQMVAKIEGDRGNDGNLSSSIRLYVLSHYMDLARDRCDTSTGREDEAQTPYRAEST